MDYIFDNERPIYIQLVEMLRIEIVSGKMKQGERLPSVRELALIARVNPNTMQKALVELEEEGLVDGIITTNIDHLHSLAGSQNVAEIQGSYAINRCSKCKVHEDVVDIWNKGKAPRCSICNGIMLSFPVYSHVGVYEPAMKRANQWISQADLVLVVGSKGNYGSYLNNLSSSAKIIQINPHPTQFDSIAVLNIREKADTVFSQL